MTVPFVQVFSLSVFSPALSLLSIIPSGRTALLIMQHIILLASLSGELLCRLGGRIWSRAKGLFTASLHNKRAWERGKELERWKRHGGMVREVEMDKSAVVLKTLIESRGTHRHERGFYGCWDAIVTLSPWCLGIKITNSFVFQGLSLPSASIKRFS